MSFISTGNKHCINAFEALTADFFLVMLKLFLERRSVYLRLKNKIKWMKLDMVKQKEILIVGNGYDIANGLKSRFSDYMKPLLCEYVFSYIYHKYTVINNKRDNFINLFANICKIRNQNISSIYATSTYFENPFIKILLHKYCPVVTLLQSYIETELIRIRDDARLSACESEDRTFVSQINLEGKIVTTNNDCEEECRQIKSKLNVISNFQNHLENLLKNINQYNLTRDLQWFDVENIIADIININIRSDLGKYIAQEVKEQFYSSLKEMGISDAQPFFKDSYNNINLQECYDGLELFSDSFKNYLKNEEVTYKQNINKTTGKTDILKLENKSFDYAISLNYTSVSKKALKPGLSENNYCHIHGSIEQNNIVIGTGSYSYDELVADPTKINDMNKIPFYKFFLRILKDTDENYHDWIDDKCYALTFYGFSFGINDYDLIRELLLKSDNNSKNQTHINPALMRITIYCLNLEDKYRILRNLIACLNKNFVNQLKHILHFEIISE